MKAVIIMSNILTPRLRLRAFMPADADDLYAYLSEPGIYRFEPGEPIDLAQARKMAQELAASADFWAVELQETHRVIGQIYFKHIEPQHLMTWELGFIFKDAKGDPLWSETYVYAMLAAEAPA